MLFRSRHDGAAQVQHALDVRRRVGDAGDLRIALDFLDAQKAYRDTRLAYMNLIGSYLTAAGQLNLAVGQEVIP